MFRFASPWFLVLLVPALGFLIYRIRQEFSQVSRIGGASSAIRVSALAGLDSPPLTLGIWGVKLLPLFKVAALSLMIVALARPQAGSQRINMITEGVNIILALDLSESMRALDFKQDKKIVTRLDAVKGVVDQFIMEREGDRIGLVVFGSNAFTQLPLTRDYDTIAFMLEHLKIGAAGPKTAIGDAIGISLKRLEDVKSESNIVILLTDGQSNAGQLAWQDAAKIAAQRGVKIYTVGVGSKGQAPFLVDGLFGKEYVYHQVNVDWDALRTIAETTGGSFFTAKDTQSLETIYKMINAMEKTRVEVEKWVEYREMYRGFLIPGIILYLVCLVLGQTRFMRIP